jgi:uncharacterized C2H2 Zn-finger protein
MHIIDDPRVHYVTCEEVGNKVQCPYCLKYYARQNSLTRHINKKLCSVLREQAFTDKIMKGVALSHDKLKEEINQKIVDEVQKIAGVSSAPAIYNQNLNVMCLNPKDNLLDILSQQTDLPNALTYIKNCALGRLAGDCRILQRVYLPTGKRPAIMYRNKSKTQFVYYNEKNDRVVETSLTVMAKKLADILQRSYSKAISLKTDLTCEKLTQSQRDELPHIEDYDRHMWNQHIHELQDEKYQKKMLKSLSLSCEKEVDESQYDE